jgi:hypothetical protein
MKGKIYQLINLTQLIQKKRKHKHSAINFKSNLYNFNRINKKRILSHPIIPSTMKLEISRFGLKMIDIKKTSLIAHSLLIDRHFQSM